jgi:hypothetical protein
VINIKIKNIKPAGLHWGRDIFITFYWYPISRLILSYLEYISISSVENEKYYSYYSNSTKRYYWRPKYQIPGLISKIIKITMWGKIPWEKFKNMPNWFKPILIIKYDAKI